MFIYIDEEYKCHISNDGTMREIETDEFDGKCDAFIEGHRFVPFGCAWTRDDGEVFAGQMITAWKDYAGLEKAQFEYEVELLRAELADADSALKELGVSIDG